MVSFLFLLLFFCLLIQLVCLMAHVISFLFRNFVRGALATINKDYGLLNDVFHQIGNTHVAHHLFSQMPHYHAKEASLHLKKKLGKFYIEDNRSLLTMVWDSWTSCRFVEDEGKVLWYKKSIKEE